MSVCGDPGAPSVKITVPLAPPATVGANCTLNEIFWPAGIVAGNERPVIPKPAPETVATLRTRLTLPVFVSVTGCDVLWPTVTLPKLSEDGLIVMPLSVPFPVREIVSGEFEASLVMTRLPEAAASDCGANWI